MRVALFSEVFLPNVDGVVNTLRRLLHHLEDRGVEAMLFAPAGGPEKFAGARVVGLPGVPLPMYQAIKVCSPLAPIEGEIDAFRPDLIHSLNPASLGLLALRQARRIGAPLVASYHTDIAAYATRYGFGAVAPLVWKFTAWMHNQAVVNMAPSRASLDQMRERGVERLMLWSRGVDAQLFHPSRRSAAMRQRLCQGRSGPLFVFCGRISREKSIHLLRPMMDRLPELNLALIGDGPARGELQRLFAGTRTNFVGVMHHDELCQALASADAFVFPSNTETFGNAPLEAMAAGLPCIAAASGGPLDYIHHGRNGLLFRAGDAAAFTVHAAALYKNEALRRRLAEAARKTAAARTWEHALDQCLGAYERAIELRDVRIAA